MSSNPEQDVLERPNVIWKAENLGGGFGASEGLIHDINLTVNAGERVALMGPDDSGRPLLLRVLSGLRPVKRGKLSVLGRELETLPYYADWDQIMPQATRRRIGVCLEEEGLLSNVSVREGLELLFRFKYGDHNKKLRDGAAKIVTTTCQKFGLGDAVEKRPNLLTASERRLAGLARAFLSKPLVVVLENPSQDIGDSSRARLWAAFEFMVTQPERTVLISTDDWALASKFCNRWIVMDRGRIVYDGSPRDFLRSGNQLVEQLKNARSHFAAYERLLQEVEVA